MCMYTWHVYLYVDDHMCVVACVSAGRLASDVGNLLDVSSLCSSRLSLSMGHKTGLQGSSASQLTSGIYSVPSEHGDYRQTAMHS